MDLIQLTGTARPHGHLEEEGSRRAGEEMLYKCRDDALLRRMVVGTPA